ncbi:HAD family hydrolase [Kistimonas asteriae]|uniref:histidinol-phosphatase n=1 Tax=Kistimonas asteriae TaxID=517724 RepID=UPI001BAD1EAD|nr:HAD family hydrolase [Kistimonas asteriae]
MALVLFDLDNTLLAGDSDHTWGEFMVDRKLVDEQAYRETNDKFYQDYLQGKLDIKAHLACCLAPLTEHAMETLHRMRDEFVQERIVPMIAQGARALIRRHQEAGDTLMIITATNRFVTEPIAHLLGIDQLLASDVEVKNARYTGKSEGIPCYQEGKVTRLKQWLDENKDITLEGSVFYSDSHNDLPLMELIDNPVAVDPDEKLAVIAQQKNWPIISLR